jgi:hypothetical protein
MYKDVWKKYPESPYAPKALYAIAWIYANELNQGQNALKNYEFLADKFPKTPFGDKAKKLIAAVKQVQKSLADSARVKKQKKTTVPQVPPDSMKNALPDTSLGNGPGNRPAIQNLNAFIKTKNTKRTSKKQNKAAVKKNTAREAP